MSLDDGMTWGLPGSWLLGYIQITCGYTCGSHLVGNGYLWKLFISFFCWFHILCILLKLLSFLLCMFPWVMWFFLWLQASQMPCRSVSSDTNPYTIFSPFVNYYIHSKKVHDEDRRNFDVSEGKHKEGSILCEDGVVVWASKEAKDLSRLNSNSSCIVCYLSFILEGEKS